MAKKDKIKQFMGLLVPPIDPCDTRDDACERAQETDPDTGNMRCYTIQCADCLFNFDPDFAGEEKPRPEFLQWADENSGNKEAEAEALRLAAKTTHSQLYIEAIEEYADLMSAENEKLKAIIKKLLDSGQKVVN